MLERLRNPPGLKVIFFFNFSLAVDAKDTWNKRISDKKTVKG
jgi:hypothetical protein